MRKKAASLMEKIFGWGILLTLLAGGLAFLGYLAALAAGGGENGAGMRISLFIQKEYFPVVIVCAAISAATGLKTPRPDTIAASCVAFAISVAHAH